MGVRDTQYKKKKHDEHSTREDTIKDTSKKISQNDIIRDVIGKKEIELTSIYSIDNLCNLDRHKRKINLDKALIEEIPKRWVVLKDKNANREASSDIDAYKTSEELFCMLRLENESVDKTLSSLENVDEISNFTYRTRQTIYRFLINVMCTVPIRPRRRLYYSCDRDRIADQKSPYFYLFGRALSILEKMLMRESKKDENLNLLEQNDVKRCLNMLRDEDARIRTLVKRFIQEIHNRCKRSRCSVKYKIKNMLINIIHEQTEPMGVSELLNLSTYILVTDGFGDSSEAQCYFSECIFPILKISNAHLYEQEMKTALEAFSQLRNECFLYTFKQLSKIFLEVNSSVRIPILNFCLAIIQVKQTTMDFAHVENYVCQIISTCFKNAHCLLISHVLTFIKERVIYNFLKAHCSTFVPKIFDEIYDLSKSYWNKDRSPEVYSIVTIVMSLDKNVFEECLKRYNFKRYKQRIENDISEDVVKYFGHDLLRESEGMSGIRRKSLPHERRPYERQAS
eukprot:jgi/Antlo1/1365/1208